MKTILVVESNRNQLLLYEQELSSDGYNVIKAENGYKAIEKLKGYSPDLVVMDLILPDMNGIELIDKILSEYREIPIIINTAYSSYMDNFMTWLADAYIIKSSDLSELKNTIKKLVEVK